MSECLCVSVSFLLERSEKNVAPMNRMLISYYWRPFRHCRISFRTIKKARTVYFLRVR